MRAAIHHMSDDWRQGSDGAHHRAMERNPAGPPAGRIPVGDQRGQRVVSSELAGALFSGPVASGRGAGAMRSALVREFQQIHGNRATSRLIGQAVSMPGVQRYVETAAAAYKDLAENNPTLAQPHRRPSFSAQKLTIDPADQLVKPLVNPDLKVADDGQLAIAMAPQPKEFYATQGIVDASNKQLEGVDSPLRLATSATTLTVPMPNQHGATTQLMKVGPTIPKQVGPVAFSDKCNEIATSIIGRPESQVTVETAEAVFQGPGGAATATLDFKGGTPNHSGDANRSGPTNLAEFVAKSSGAPVRPSDARARLQGPSAAAAPDTAKKYGRMAPADLSARSQELGINQFAAPEVGEAFATHSVVEPGKHTPLDYTKENQQGATGLERRETLYAGLAAMKVMSIEAVVKALQDYASQFQHYVRSPWTWHFAAVVARSGGDWVTLENYNRADELEKACLSLAAQVEATYRGEIDQIMSELRDDMNGKSVAEFNTFIRGGANYVVDELNKHLQAQVQPAIANFPAASEMWFFQMYGSKRGQSFHEAMAQTGDFVNPLTVRWREPVTAEYVADCKAQLTEKVIELLAAHNREDDKQHLNEVLPQIVEKAKRDIDQATTKPEVTKLTKRALASMDSRTTLLSLVH